MYRTPANTAKTYKTLHRFAARTTKGGANRWLAATGVTLGGAGLLTSAHLAGLLIPCGIAAVAVAVLYQRSDACTARIVAWETERKIVVDGVSPAFEMELPVRVSGDQRSFDGFGDIFRGADVRRHTMMRLVLRGAHDRTLVVTEHRGGDLRAYADWPNDKLADDLEPTLAIYVETGVAVALRRHVEEANAEVELFAEN